MLGRSFFPASCDAENRNPNLSPSSVPLTLPGLTSDATNEVNGSRNEGFNAARRYLDGLSAPRLLKRVFDDAFDEADVDEESSACQPKIKKLRVNEPRAPKRGRDSSPMEEEEDVDEPEQKYCRVDKNYIFVAPIKDFDMSDVDDDSPKLTNIDDDPHHKQAFEKTLKWLLSIDPRNRPCHLFTLKNAVTVLTRTRVVLEPVPFYCLLVTNKIVDEIQIGGTKYVELNKQRLNVTISKEELHLDIAVGNETRELYLEVLTSVANWCVRHRTLRGTVISVKSGNPVRMSKERFMSDLATVTVLKKEGVPEVVDALFTLGFVSKSEPKDKLTYYLQGIVFGEAVSC